MTKLRQQVLDQEARITEQKEATRRMQESLLALQAFIAAQGLAASPLVVPSPGRQPPAPQARNNIPRHVKPIPPPGQAPEQGPTNPSQEKGKGKAANPEGKENP